MTRSVILFVFLIIFSSLYFLKPFINKRISRQLQDFKNKNHGKKYFFYKVSNKLSSYIETFILPNLPNDVEVIVIPKNGWDNYKGKWEIRMMLFGKRSSLVLPCFMQIVNGKCKWFPFKKTIMDFSKNMITQQELIDNIKFK